ncbi:hypothetical protein [uncultured Rubinisphaera sp.]|uniref:hypothetical protein n=1 Tax=uncultured Rubinisphaera sp. TaxID=1678686 RepID=UPI0030DA351F
MHELVLSGDILVSCIVKVDESNFDFEYSNALSVIKEFLYLYFEISEDCLPLGDWCRSDRVAFDVFQYLDIEYTYQYQFLSLGQLRVIHQGAAIYLLCQLAEVFEDDEGRESSKIANFCSAEYRKTHEATLIKIIPDIYKIHGAFQLGRIVKTPCIQEAFEFAFTPNASAFWSSLQQIREEVISKTFTNVIA